MTDPIVRPLPPKEPISDERAAVEEVQELVAQLAEAVLPVWDWGDGEGGWVWRELRLAFAEAGLSTSLRTTGQQRRRPIPTATRRAVYERDQYRCVVCGTWIDLTLDHIVPWSQGGPDTVENLQTMCRPHNSEKGDR